MTSERLPDWTGFKTIAKCYPSATWERSIGNLEVVKFQIDRHFYVGSVAGRHYIIGSPSRLKRLSAACAFCLNPKVLLWVTGQKEPPDTWEGLGLGEGGSLVIAQESAHVSPKAWRQIRSKLHFTIRRWQQPTNREISDWATKEQVWVRAPKPGHAKNDGSTVFVHPNR